MARLRTTDDAGRVFNAYSPVFTLKHNAVRAARRAGVSDYTLEQTVEGWTWSASIEKEGADHNAERVTSDDQGPIAPARQQNHEAPPKTVEELLQRIAIEHSLEGAALIIQALHTAFAEGAVHKPAQKKRGKRRPLYLFNEPLTKAA